MVVIFFLVVILAFISAEQVIVPNIDEVCNAPSLDEVSGIPAEQSCILHDGITRCYYTYIPESAKSSSVSVPLVLDMHGYNLCAVYSSQYAGWAKIAEEFGFVVVWPQGNMNANYSNQPCWSFGSCCCAVGDIPPGGTAFDVPNANIDDIGFLRQIVSNTVSYASDVVIDTKRIYFAGHSNGCMMAQAMAALDSDLVAAVCCHASSLMVEPAINYKPRSVQVVIGDLDPTIGMMFGNDNHILETWGKINNCTNNSTTIDDSQLYATHTRSNCSNGTIVQTIELFNAGHFSYLGVPPNISLSIGQYPGAVTPSVDTTLLSYDFCRQYELEVEPELPEPTELVPADIFLESADNDFTANETDTSTNNTAIPTTAIQPNATSNNNGQQQTDNTTALPSNEEDVTSNAPLFFGKASILFTIVMGLLLVNE